MAELVSGIDWGSIADWVSGIGSLTAAIVAIWLAKRGERIKLRGYCGLRLIVGGGYREDVVTFSVTNVGTRATIISNISMHTGIYKKRHAILNSWNLPNSQPMPCPLSDGQTANWQVSNPLGTEWLVGLMHVETAHKPLVTSSWDVRTLRVRIHTNHGTDLVLKPEKGFREALLKLLAPAGGPPTRSV